MTYTTRYNRDYWVSLDGLEKHYERAEVDAQRTSGGASYDIKTKNLTRLVLRETEHAKEIKIDGQTLKVKAAPEITLARNGSAWKVDKNGREPGLHKTHALQGPIDDAFLDPFLLVRPTGTPWNDEVNQQALRTLARFDRMWGRFFRGHPFVKDDKDVTEADFAKYHVVLFGDPGSNKWIAKLNGKLPVKWTRETVTLGAQTFPAGESFPALIYPNPLNPAKYVVLNTGLTIEDRGYNGDYGTPLWGDYAIVKVKPGAEVPEMLTAGLFDENWNLPKQSWGTTAPPERFRGHARPGEMIPTGSYGLASGRRSSLRVRSPRSKNSRRRASSPNTSDAERYHASSASHCFTTDSRAARTITGRPPTSR